MADEKPGCLYYSFVWLQPLGNLLAKKPKVKGPTSGQVGKPLAFKCEKWSPLKVDIDFDWGDGTKRGLKSDTEASHAWAKPGVYEVTARECCPLGAHDKWGDAIKVTIL